MISLVSSIRRPWFSSIRRCFLLAGWNYDGQHDPKQMEEELLNNSGYQTTDAVKNRKVYTVPAKHVLCVSQYIVNAVEDLADAVYSE